MMFKTYKLLYDGTTFQLSVIRQLKLVELVIGKRVFLLTWSKEWL